MEGQKKQQVTNIPSIFNDSDQLILSKSAVYEFLITVVIELIFLSLALPVALTVPRRAGLNWSGSGLAIAVVIAVAVAIWVFIAGIFADRHQDKSIRRQKLRRHVQTEFRRWVLFTVVSPLTAVLLYQLSLWMLIPFPLAMLSGLLGCVLGAGLVHLIVPPAHVENDSQDIVRGSRLLSYKEALQSSQVKTQGDATRVLWGGVWLPSQAVHQHFQVEGTTGSGKTIAIRMLMQSVLPHIGKGHNHRAIIYDPKNELPSLLHGMNLQCPIKLLNPFDQRAWAWDIAKDITSSAMALPMAKILIPPDEKSNQPYFSEAAAMLLSGVIEALMSLKPGTWTLRDLLLIFRSKDRIHQVLQQVPEVSYYADIYFNQSDATLGSILSSGFNKLNQFKQIAALWETAPQKMSLTDWIEQHEESILLLGSHQKFNESMKVVNNLIIQVVLTILLDQPDNARNARTLNRRTFLIIDELTSLGEIQMLPEALCKVRSKGGSIVLGFQERNDVEEVFGYRNAQTIFANTSHKLYLRVAHHRSAEEIAKELGTHERLETGAASDFFNGGASRGDREQDAKRERQLVLPSELMRLPPAGASTGMVAGFGQTPWIQHPYRVTMPWHLVTSQLSEPAQDYPDHIQRPKSEQQLNDFSTSEMDILGIKYPKPRLVRKS